MSNQTIINKMTMMTAMPSAKIRKTFWFLPWFNDWHENWHRKMDLFNTHHYYPFLCYVLIFFEERKKRKTSLYWIIHCSFLCVWCVWKWLNVILFIFIFNTCWSLVWFAHTRVFSLYEKPFFSTKFTIFLVNFLTNIFIMIMVSHIIIRSVLMNILYFVKVFFVFSEKTLCGFSLLTW